MLSQERYRILMTENPPDSLLLSLADAREYRCALLRLKAPFTSKLSFNKFTILITFLKNILRINVTKIQHILKI